MAVLDDVQTQLRTRIHELEREIAGLEKVAQAAAKVNGGTRAEPAKPKRGKRGRPKGQGKRLEAVMAVINTRPDMGWLTSEIAAELGMKPNYLYRALPNLEQAGKIRRDDNKPPRWYPT